MPEKASGQRQQVLDALAQAAVGWDTQEPAQGDMMVLFQPLWAGHRVVKSRLHKGDALALAQLVPFCSASGH